MNNTIIIVGKTKDGKKFRPSNWYERLGTIGSTFSFKKRLKLHKFISLVWVDDYNVPGIKIDLQLQIDDNILYNFLLNFAQQNKLEIIPND